MFLYHYHCSSSLSNKKTWQNDQWLTTHWSTSVAGWQVNGVPAASSIHCSPNLSTKHLVVNSNGLKFQGAEKGRLPKFKNRNGVDLERNKTSCKINLLLLCLYTYGEDKCIYIYIERERERYEYLLINIMTFVRINLGSPPSTYTAPFSSDPKHSGGTVLTQTMASHQEVHLCQPPGSEAMSCWNPSVDDELWYLHIHFLHL